MLSRKNTAGNITLAHLKLYFITVTKSAWHWNKTDLETDQQNATKTDMEADQLDTADNPEANPYNCGHLIFDSDVKNIYWKKREPCQSKVLVMVDVHLQKNEISAVSFFL